MCFETKLDMKKEYKLKICFLDKRITFKINCVFKIKRVFIDKFDRTYL